MKWNELREKIIYYKDREMILEAFVLQSAYIESLIKLFTEIKFNISIKNGDLKTVSALEKQVNDYTLFQLIKFSFEAQWISESERRLLDRYRKKRNIVLHDLVKKISQKNFEKELKESYCVGEKILLFPKFSASSKFFKLIEKQESKLRKNTRFSLARNKERTTDREDKILKMRLEGNTYQRIGDVFNITRERVRQILNSALSKVEGTYKKLSPVVVGVDEMNENIEKIISIISQTYDISREDLLGNRRVAKLVFPRHLAIYFLRKNLKLSFPKIAKIMRKKDHTTALHAYEKICHLIKSENINIKYPMIRVK